LYAPFTPFHRGGSGPPLVCLHGFMDTWRSWELVLPALERHHDVLALTLAGHAGGPEFEGEPSGAALAEAVEREMDAAGWSVAHVAGSSLGGYLALRLAARGRALSVVAFAPAGGWAPGDPSWRDLLERQRRLHLQARALAPRADAILSTAEGRRRATELLTVNFDHIPSELLAHQLLAVAGCPAACALIEHGLGDVWTIDAEAIACPVRIVWGASDRLLAWPLAAVRYRDHLLPHADWVVLDGVGHYPQFDVPVEAAQLIVGFTGG
jgi:pimeloyl-ACP methyl ester carboxylesterase